MTQPPQGWTPPGGQPGYPPQQPGYPPQGPAYPPQGSGYPPQGPGYPPRTDGFGTTPGGFRPQFPAPPPSAKPNGAKVCLIIGAVVLGLTALLVVVLLAVGAGVFSAVTKASSTVSSAPITRATTAPTTSTRASTPVTTRASATGATAPASAATVAPGTKSVQGQTLPDKIGSFTKLTGQDKPSAGVVAVAIYTAGSKGMAVMMFDNSNDIQQALGGWQKVGNNLCGTAPAGTTVGSGSACGRVMKDGFLMVSADDTATNVSGLVDQVYATLK